jgi:hypothetical protein
LKWAFLEEVDWVVIRNLGEIGKISEGWTTSVSVVVFSAGKGGSDNPRKVLPESVLEGGHLNHILFSLGLDSVFDGILNSGKS